MNIWISLLRGINVGGKNRLPMKELRSLLEEIGCSKVQTYIQSGNCFFESAETDTSLISGKISEAVNNSFGFKPQVVTLSAREFQKAISNNPYPEAVDDPKSVHFYFLAEPAGNADIDTLTTISKPTEKFFLKGNVFYLLAPEGIGRSKLAEKAEKKLGVSTTARNYRTVMKISELAGQH